MKWELMNTLIGIISNLTSGYKFTNLFRENNILYHVHLIYKHTFLLYKQDMKKFSTKSDENNKNLEFNEIKELRKAFYNKECLIERLL